jgi:hypothetical protein
MIKGIKLDMGGGRMEHVTITLHSLVGIVGCGNYKSKMTLV